VREFIESDEQLLGGQPFILIGHSQGTLVSRALLEQWDNHPVQMFLSLAGPHLGQYGVFPDLVSNPFLRGLATSAAWTVLYTKVKCTAIIPNMWFCSILCDSFSSWRKKSFALRIFGAIHIATPSSWPMLCSLQRLTIMWSTPTHRAFEPTSLVHQLCTYSAVRTTTSSCRGKAV
jgi:hypothetical protein